MIGEIEIDAGLFLSQSADMVIVVRFSRQNDRTTVNEGKHFWGLYATSQLDMTSRTKK